MTIDYDNAQVVTILKKTAKPITEVPFPAVTICGSGFQLINIMFALRIPHEQCREENRGELCQLEN